MAAPGTPPDPLSEKGKKEIVKRTKTAVHGQHPNVAVHLITMVCKWMIESLDLQLGDQCLTASSLSQALNKCHVHHTRSQSDPEKWLKDIIQTIFEEDGIQARTHFVGQLALTPAGKPSVQGNKDIQLTPRGACAIFQRLMADSYRVTFANIMWAVMTQMCQAYADLRKKFDKYKAEKDAGMAQLRNAADVLLNVASATLHVSRAEANLKILEKAFKQGRKCMLRGRLPKQAMVKAKLATLKQRLPPIHQCFTPAGATADAFRIYAMATVLSHVQPQIQALQDARARKRKVDETMDMVTNHFHQNRTFEIPLLSETEQTKAYFENQHQRQVARRA